MNAMNHDYLFDGAPETRRGLETRQNAIIALQWLMEEEDNPTVRAAHYTPACAGKRRHP